MALGDRAIVNPAGVPGTGTDVTPLLATAGPNAGELVAYVANNPQCPIHPDGYWLRTPTSDETRLQTPDTNNIDLAIYKDLNFGERMKFRLGAQFGNIINHPQYIPGSNPGLWLGSERCERLQLSGNQLRFASSIPATQTSTYPKTVFASNARTMALVAKFTF